MPSTANYSWTIPTPGGDTGVWDTILNAAFDDVDADLFALQESVVDSLGDFVLSGIEGREAVTTPGAPHWAHSTANGAYNTFGTNFNPLYFALGSLPVGQLLTKIRSYALAVAGMTVKAELVHIARDGTVTTVSAGHSIPTGGVAETETAGIAHTILADKAYYIRIRHTAGVGAGTTLVRSVGFTTEAQP